MYKSKRSLKVYEAPLGLNGKQQVPRIQLQGQWLGALGYPVDEQIERFQGIQSLTSVFIELTRFPRVNLL